MTFLSEAGHDAGVAEHLGLENQIGVVSGTRDVRKEDLVNNTATPTVEVDPQTYEVRADGELLTCEPAEVLPMAQRYHLF